MLVYQSSLSLQDLNILPFEEFLRKKTKTKWNIVEHIFIGKIFLFYLLK